ncbi:MAG: NADH-quinone oxidoreductase subunit E, partial [Chloroflexi bacterium]|nr:NADH-quinone oxidoreductase subunit E [Chloroflexota bacterium]
MDLHHVDAAPTATELAAVDAVLDGPLGPPDRAHADVRSNDVRGDTELRVSRARREAAQGRRELLLPSLWAVQRAVGWISPAALGYVCERLRV